MEFQSYGYFFNTVK